MTNTIEDLARRIFTERAAFYTNSAAHKNPQMLAKLVVLAQPQPGWLALDVATGTGHTAFALAPYVQHVTAIDLTSAMLDEARKLQADLGITNVDFRTANVHDLPFPAASFDLLTSRIAPHHFSDIRRALSEMVRVLRPGGRLVIDDRSIPENDFVDKTMNLLDTYHDPSHVREYRPSEWQHMLSDAGFKVNTLKPYHQQRPVTSLTHNADANSIARINELIASLNDIQRREMNVEQKDGQWYSNHWFVILSATKA
jgi:ubiquinone/menaquinone biosynthesis C-methylase UbiE